MNKRRLSWLALHLSLLAGTAGCLIRTAPSRPGPHGFGVTHYHCHAPHGPRGRQICHAHRHGPNHHP